MNKKRNLIKMKKQKMVMMTKVLVIQEKKKQKNLLKINKNLVNLKMMTSSQMIIYLLLQMIRQDTMIKFLLKRKKLLKSINKKNWIVNWMQMFLISILKTTHLPLKIKSKQVKTVSTKTQSKSKQTIIHNHNKIKFPNKIFPPFNNRYYNPNNNKLSSKNRKLKNQHNSSNKIIRPRYLSLKSHKRV